MCAGLEVLDGCGSAGSCRAEGRGAESVILLVWGFSHKCCKLHELLAEEVPECKKPGGVPGLGG